MAELQDARELVEEIIDQMKVKPALCSDLQAHTSLSFLTIMAG